MEAFCRLFKYIYFFFSIFLHFWMLGVFPCILYLLIVLLLRREQITRIFEIFSSIIYCFFHSIFHSISLTLFSFSIHFVRLHCLHYDAAYADAAAFFIFIHFFQQSLAFYICIFNAPLSLHIYGLLYFPLDC